MKIHNYRAYQLVFFCMGVIEVLLALRFIFKLFGANPENMFARIIYWLSGILLFPFNGLFRGTPVADGTLQRFEPSTIIAMVIYALLAWGIAKWILIFKSKPALKE
ncbi:MAG: YggT family protein [Candidatus Peribacteraceae bacterium]|nr:YggT family protein [Candidatus Peribacteraceae bacterium]